MNTDPVLNGNFLVTIDASAFECSTVDDVLSVIFKGHPVLSGAESIKRTIRQKCLHELKTLSGHISNDAPSGSAQKKDYKISIRMTNVRNLYFDKVVNENQSVDSFLQSITEEEKMNMIVLALR